MLKDTSRAGQAGGGSFKEKNYKPRKNWPTEWAHGDQPVRCSNRVFRVNEPLAGPWRWCGDLFWCGWLPGEIRNLVVGCEMTHDAMWGNVVSCEMSCAVMWSDASSFYVMRLLVLCDDTWCTAMSCDNLSFDELLSVVKCCGATR